MTLLDFENMGHGEKRFVFSKMLMALMLCAEAMGYRVRFGKEHCNHMEFSLHYEGLAEDIELFIWNGTKWVYLTKTKDYEPLGEIWEKMGGSWGGRFKKKDGNHFSVSHYGRK